VLGTIVLLLPGVAVNGRLSLWEAVFTATSSLTVTGLTIITPATDLTLFGKIILLILIQIGGVGFMFVAIIGLMLIGRRITITDRLAVTSSMGLQASGKFLILLKRVLAGILLIESLGALLLWVRWLEFFPPITALGYAIFHSVSAFCNAGFDLFHGLPQFTGIPSDDFTLVVMGTSIFLGGLGIPVLSDLFTRGRRHWLSLHSRLTLVVALTLTLLAWGGIFLSEAVQPGVLHDLPLDQQLIRAWFQAISNRTAGFASLPHFNALAPATALIIMGTMFVGCAPASMGGGITTGTLAVLLVTLKSYAQGLPHVRVWGRRLEMETVRRAGAILTIAILLLALATWSVMLSQPTMDFERAFFEVVSAFSTCGLSLGVTKDLNGFSRVVIMVMMFWGRLGPLTIMIALTQRSQRQARLVTYAQEQVLIG
jgi:trk system potassium uptake protein TrkH